uniref:Uncharacterized protein n=1 Tax=Trichogramma kaykai TaxID=54128 RepID=A0ABD2WIM1_9HYME
MIIFFSIDRSVIIYDHSKQQRYAQFTEKPRAYTIFAVTARTLRSLRSWTIFSVSGDGDKDKKNICWRIVSANDVGGRQKLFRTIWPGKY